MTLPSNLILWGQFQDFVENKSGIHSFSFTRVAADLLYSFRPSLCPKFEPTFHLQNSSIFDQLKHSSRSFRPSHENGLGKRIAQNLYVLCKFQVDFPLLRFKAHQLKGIIGIAFASLLTGPKTYQDQFVNTRFCRVWSNKDMDLLSFWPILPQLASVSQAFLDVFRQ